MGSSSTSSTAPSRWDGATGDQAGRYRGRRSSEGQALYEVRGKSWSPSVEGTITLKVLADTAVDPKFGTVSSRSPRPRRHRLRIGRVTTSHAHGDRLRWTNDRGGGEYAGLDRFEARKRIVEDMQGLG